MRDARTTRAAWLKVGAGLLGLVAASACATRATHRQTDIMAKTAVRVSATELRIRVNALADRMSGRLEVTADRIRAETQDRAVRHRALVFKINAVPAVYSAAYRADPFVSAMDAWALAFQITEYVEDGAGRAAFGPQQSIAREGAHAMLADADAVMEHIANRPEAFTRARARMAAWVKEHPIQDAASRPSMGAFMADLLQEQDAFAAVGAVSDTLESVSERLNTYAAQLPRQARWQAELLISEAAGEGGVEQALGDIHSVGVAARRATDLLNEVPSATEAGSSVRDAVSGERRALLAGVDLQRMQTLEYVTAERLAVVAALRDERLAVLGALHQERIEALKEIDGIKSRAVESALIGLREIVDHTLWRVAALLSCLMILAASLGIVAYRLTVGRRRGPEAG